MLTNGSGVPLTIEVDHDGGWVQARGQCWWGDRFQVEEGRSGDTVVRQRTFNCASGVGAKLVPFTAGRGHRRRGERALRCLLEDFPKGWAVRPGCCRTAELRSVAAYPFGWRRGGAKRGGDRPMDRSRMRACTAGWNRWASR